MPGPARLTETGVTKLRRLLGRALTEPERIRLDRAAAAHWDYQQDVHYVVHDGDVYIIDQTTHEVLADLAAATQGATKSRWHDGLAQAIEAKHGLTIRDDPNPETTKTLTARELYAQDQLPPGCRCLGYRARQRGTFPGAGPVVENRRHSPVLLIPADHHG